MSIAIPQGFAHLDGRLKAIAAMSQNRVIGDGNRIPWHLPEDFKWFKKTTTGHVLIMGRKTYESIGRPLPNRLTVVLSRSSQQIPGVITVRNLADLQPDQPPLAGRELFLCGGAQLYTLALPLCSDLFLTIVRRHVVGDTSFPPHEHLFAPRATLLETKDFSIVHYVRSARPEGVGRNANPH